MGDTGLIRPQFHVGSTVPFEFFIDRTQPMHDAINFLLTRKGNILIVGERKIGKTSFVHKLKWEMEKHDSLCVEVNLITYDDEPESFLRETLLLLCYEVGEKIFKKSASELLLSLGNSGPPKGKEYTRFFQIYSLARSISISRARKTSLSGSVKIPLAEAGLGRENQDVTNIGNFHPFEFIELTRELMAICQKHGYQSIIVFADEANRLAAQASQELLRSFFDVFSARNIQFVFVADISLVDYKPIENLFDLIVRLKHFPEIHMLTELLERYYNKQLGQDFSEFVEVEAVQRIWDLSKGHPYLIQLLCEGAVSISFASRRAKVTNDDVMQAWLKALNEDRRLIKLWD